MAGPLVENIPKVRQNNLFADVLMRLSMKGGDVSQAFYRILGGVFALKVSDKQQKSTPLLSCLQQAGIDAPKSVTGVKHARPVRSMIKNSQAFVLNIMSNDITDDFEG